MKHIKITAESVPKLEKLVDEVNGKANAHTLTPYDIIAMGKRSEQRLDAAGILKKNRPGTILRFRSGEKMPGTYKYSRIANTGILERRAAGWYLVSFSTTNAFPSDGWYERLALTESGEIDAINHICE